MERALTSLALDPQITVLLFKQFELLLALNINLLHFALTVETDDRFISFKDVFTAKAGLLDFSKSHKTGLLRTHRRDINVPRVLAREKLLLRGVSKDGLKDPTKRLLDLVRQVIFCVDG
jgi:hypothetical protein